MIQILKGHTSPETAFVVADYPYGFRLRCKIRYWLETHPKFGVRLVTQTTNPKVPGEKWNKAKVSTYCKFGGCLFLDDKEHVHWAGLTEYSTADEAGNWIAQYGEGNVIPEMTRLWYEAKVAYEARAN